MRVLMLGWEFPPFISGGLGTACYGLTKGMSEIGTEVLFVLPRPVEASFATHVTLLTPKSAGSGRRCTAWRSSRTSPSGPWMPASAFRVTRHPPSAAQAQRQRIRRESRRSPKARPSLRQSRG